MAKLICVHGNDNHLLDTLTSALRNGGYAWEYAAVQENTANTMRADITLVCYPQKTEHIVTMGGLTLDMDNLDTFNQQGEHVHFTPTEFALLSYMLRHRTRAVSRRKLLSAVWHFDGDTTTRVADDTVKRLRKKLTPTRLRIETVWGYGFKLYEL